jgi:hypothetical protein
MAVATANYTGSLPQGVTLAQGEQVVAVNSFMFSLAHFFLHTKLALTDRRLAGQSPNTLMGLIPIGSNKVSYPLKNIAEVGTSTSISFRSLLVGVALMLGGLAAQNAVGIVLAIVGVFLFLRAFQASFDLTNNGGRTIRIKIAIFDKAAAQEFADAVNHTIAERDS